MICQQNPSNHVLFDKNRKTLSVVITGNTACISFIMQGVDYYGWTACEYRVPLARKLSDNLFISFLIRLRYLKKLSLINCAVAVEYFIMQIHSYISMQQFSALSIKGVYYWLPKNILISVGVRPRNDIHRGFLACLLAQHNWHVSRKLAKRVLTNAFIDMLS